MIDRQALLNLRIPDTRADHTKRDTMLYALGLGLGANPTDPWDLGFVTEPALRALPTMCLVLASHGLWMSKHPTGIDYGHVLDGEREIIFHAPVPVGGTMRASLRVCDVVDKGAERGALIFVERMLSTDDGTPVATMRQTVFARANGGFGGPARTLSRPPEPPDRAPDHIVRQSTLPQQALIYRLSGDYNPLHSDPARAAAAGFPRPVLHGLASFGMAAVALIRTACQGDADRLLRIAGRFSAPVLPGDDLETRIWVDGTSLAFQMHNRSSGKLALSHGQAQMRRAPYAD